MVLTYAPRTSRGSCGAPASWPVRSPELCFDNPFFHGCFAASLFSCGGPFVFVRRLKTESLDDTTYDFVFDALFYYDHNISIHIIQ